MFAWNEKISISELWQIPVPLGGTKSAFLFNVLCEAALRGFPEGNFTPKYPRFARSETDAKEPEINEAFKYFHYLKRDVHVFVYWVIFTIVNCNHMLIKYGKKLKAFIIKDKNKRDSGSRSSNAKWWIYDVHLSAVQIFRILSDI